MPIISEFEYYQCRRTNCYIPGGGMLPSGVDCGAWAEVGIPVNIQKEKIVKNL